MSILALNKVNYSYKNGKKVLNDVSIEFEKGKFYTILGVSGSGKTTLLSLLAGLDEPSSGQILYNNEDIKAKGYENVEVKCAQGDASALQTIAQNMADGSYKAVLQLQPLQHRQWLIRNVIHRHFSAPNQHLLPQAL